MFLKRLETVGFKSFANRTVADLSRGIVVVVGPNGSGKSNISDAIRWVLGEQSAKAVRARKPEEVIFAGSANRQPLGMAEVSLLFDNSDGTLPLDYGEVRVSRRLYRSGESEYLLNNARVRLRDVTNLLLHAQLGPDSYCVIGQGSVDELILQRPEERRVVFENAADIRRHQLKLADTRSKLGSTEGNLTRVQDVIAELAPHVKRLKGQAERAARAAALSQELRTLSLRYYRVRLRDARAEAAAAERVLQAAEASARTAEACTREAQERWSSGEHMLGLLDTRIGRLRPRVDELQQRAADAERALAVARERLAAVDEQAPHATRERERLAERVADLEREIVEQERAAAALAQAPGGVEAEMAALRSAGQAHARAAESEQRSLAERRARRETLERQIQAAEGALAQGERRLREAESLLAADAARRADREARLRQLEDGQREVDQQREDADQQAAAAHDELAAAEQARRRVMSDVERLRGEVRAAAQRLDRLHGALGALGVDQRGADGTLPEAWRTALAGLPVLGVAGELAARVRPLDRILRGHLMRMIVVREDASAREAHRRLADALGAGATSWSVLSVQGLLLPAPGEHQVQGDGTEGPALADWGRKLAELEAELDDARAAHVAAEARLGEAVAAAGAADERARRAAAHSQETAALAREARRRADAGRAELTALRGELAAAAQRGESLAAEQRALAERTEQARADLAAARAERDRVGAGLTEAEDHLARLRAEVADRRGRLASLEQAEAQRRAEHQGRLALLARARDELATARQSHVTLVQRLAELEAQRTELAPRLAGLATEATSTAREVGPLAEELAAAERERTMVAADRRGVERQLAEARGAERAEQERRESALLRAQRARDGLAALEREVAESAEAEGDDGEGGGDWTHQLRLALADPGVLEPPDVEEPAIDLDLARRRIATLQRELRAAGGVSSTVVDEYRELSERHDFLQQQAHDLREAMADLRDAAGELEGHMRDRFAEVFEAVNTAFQQCFEALFGGGEARLVLTQPDDVLSTGVDIVARPPGKKLQGLLTMSGGERALTVVALLFGLLKVNPTPFCVLDEVDAALDEANVRRFAQLLAELAQGIQFVVVTHNRATMEMADAMYGVSMDAAGVSRIFSVKPQAAAERGAAAGRP